MMDIKPKFITIFGGTGFLGRELLRQLLNQTSYQIKIISRYGKISPEFNEFIAKGVLIIIKENIENIYNIEDEIKDSYAFINLVGLLFETNSGDFQRVHVDAVKKLASFAKKNNIQKFIHISALGVDRSLTSQYAKTKLNGEQELLNIIPTATILRPSVIFGEEDNFYNQFAQMARFSPFLPLIGEGKTKFQPVYVGDVALAILKLLANEKLEGKIYELGGNNIVTFKQILLYILKIIEKKRILLPISFSLAKILGLLLQYFPNPPITADQVKLLKYDNILSKNYPGLLELGITPRDTEEITSQYLKKYQ